MNELCMCNNSNHSYFIYQRDRNRQLIVSAVTDLIKMECDCVLEDGAIDQEHLLCDHSQLNETVFRAQITTHQLTRNDLLTIIQHLVTTGRLVLNASTVVRLDDSCPVEISSFTDPLCTVPTNDQSKGTQSDDGVPTEAIIGSVIAVIIIIILLLASFVLLMLYQRNRKR